MVRDNFTLLETTEMLTELDKFDDLKEFKNGDQFVAFKKKYRISGGQLNFLLSVVATERIPKTIMS